MGRRRILNFDHCHISFMPANWMKKAMALRGEGTYMVATLLWLVYSWHWEKPEAERRMIRLSDSLVEWAGLNPKTRNRALHRLHEAGLIRYEESGVGKSPICELIYIKITKGSV